MNEDIKGKLRQKEEDNMKIEKEKGVMSKKKEQTKREVRKRGKMK